MSNTTPTPTASALLIDALNPKQRSILYNALLMFKCEAEQHLAEHIITNNMAQPLSNRVAEFLKWNIDEAKVITNQLFAECFPDDLNTLHFFQQDVPRKEFIEKPANAA